MITSVPPAYPSPSVVLLAAFDSQLKWCGRVRDEFEARGFSCRTVVPGVRSALSAEQITDAGFQNVEHLSLSEAIEVAARADVVVSALSGPATQAFWFGLGKATAGAGAPPVTVSGWVGVIIEKITAGYLDRCLSDVIAVNSRADLAHFAEVSTSLDLDPGNLVLTGLPILRRSAAPERIGPIRQVVFADQPTVPAAADERLFLYRGIIGYARAHPDRHVLLKPRHRAGEDTFHRMLHHPEALLAKDALPSNLSIDYTPISELLPRTDLLLTMSSTACLEAIDHGCRVGLVLDLGVHERYGNHVFLDSGLLRTFDQLTADDLGRPRDAWRDSYFFPRSGSAVEILANRVQVLLDSGERPSARVRQSAYVQGAAAFHRAVIAQRRPEPQRRPRLRRWVARSGRAVLPPILVGPVRRAAHLVAGAR